MFGHLTTVFVLLHLANAHEQFAAVKGKLMCGAEVAKNVVVKLYDQDVLPDPPDLLDSDRSDQNGEFKLKGSTDEPTQIEPMLRIYTDCNDQKLTPGLRAITFFVPYEYVTDRGEVPRYFDMGTINLETRFSGEKREVLERRRHHRYQRLTYDTEADFFEGL